MNLVDLSKYKVSNSSDFRRIKELISKYEAPQVILLPALENTLNEVLMLSNKFRQHQNSIADIEYYNLKHKFITLAKDLIEELPYFTKCINDLQAVFTQLDNLFETDLTGDSCVSAAAKLNLILFSNYLSQYCKNICAQESEIDENSEYIFLIIQEYQVVNSEVKDLPYAAIAASMYKCEKLLIITGSGAIRENNGNSISKHYNELSYNNIIELSEAGNDVPDSATISICKENSIPVVISDINSLTKTTINNSDTAPINFCYMQKNLQLIELFTTRAILQNGLLDSIKELFKKHSIKLFSSFEEERSISILTDDHPLPYEIIKQLNTFAILYSSKVCRITIKDSEEILQAASLTLNQSFSFRLMPSDTASKIEMLVPKEDSENAMNKITTVLNKIKDNLPVRNTTYQQLFNTAT